MSAGILYSNQWYQIRVTPTQTLQFLDATGTVVLVKSVKIHTEIIIGDKIRTIRQNVRLDSQKGKITQPITARTVNAFCLNKVDVTCTPATPEIKFAVTVRFRRDVKISRLAICLDLALPLTQIVKRNRQLVKKDFAARYWLDKQGARFGSGANTILIYHTPLVSSLEVKSLPPRLTINLDYYRDHPQITNNPQGGYQDASPALYRGGESRTNSFSIYCGYQPDVTVRLMSAPAGFLATHVWTEHACHSDLRIHKALYYGSETVDRSTAAQAGFIKHNIPVTKSVFYHNTAGIKCEDPSGIFTAPMVSITGSPDFIAFLKDIRKHGRYDICLHCPAPITSSSTTISAALAYMQKEFASTCWIDHIWYRPNGEKPHCHESFTCEGLIPHSPHYTLPLWCGYGIRYFWNYAPDYLEPSRVKEQPWLLRHHLSFVSAALELLETREYLNALAFLKHKVSGKLLNSRATHSFDTSDHIPRLDTRNGTEEKPHPLYWTHPTLTRAVNGSPVDNGEGDRIYSWTTRGNFFPTAADDDPYTQNNLEFLIREWGVCLVHAYYTSVFLGGDRNRAFSLTPEGHVKISDYFETVLEKLDDLRNQGDLYLTTIKDLLDYWIKLEKIVIQYQPVVSSVLISNHNKESIEDLALVCDASDVLVNGQRPRQKKYGEDLIFWFDLDALASVTLNFPSMAR